MADTFAPPDGQSPRGRAARRGAAGEFSGEGRWKRLRRQLGAIRGARDAGALLAWVVRRVGQEVKLRAVHFSMLRKGNTPRMSHCRVDRALGAELVALGARAQAVFRATARVARALNGSHVDVIVADALKEIGNETGNGAAPPGAPVVVLTEAPPRLRVPAFDPRIDHPVGWKWRVGDRAGALGPLARLPAGVEAHREVRARDRRRLRDLHHVEDVAAYHADPVARAGELARLAANGVVVHLADGGPDLELLLGPELHRLMTQECAGLDPDAREWLSIRMRRAALSEHTLAARARQCCERAMAFPPRLPQVSVLMVTRRPELLPGALASVARQNWPRLELVLGLHGEGWRIDEVRARARELPFPAKVLEVDRSFALGAALNLVADAADGTLLTKMDDDDVYDAEHVRDLVLAYEYSGAELVGKTIQFYWLGVAGETVQMRRELGERYINRGMLPGSALLLPRETLRVLGGWRRLPAAEDQALVLDVICAGGTVYRTHGTGYVVVRHGAGHAARRSVSDLKARAEVIREGWDPELARLAPDLPLPFAREPAPGDAA